MSDVKDILGMPRAGAAGGEEKPDKSKKRKEEEKIKRPEGMSREAFALLRGSHPIIASQMVASVKKKDVLAKPKPSTKGNVTYQYRQFKNQARTDGLELWHWVKCYKGANGDIRDPEESEYPMVKFNKKVSGAASFAGCAKQRADGWCTAMRRAELRGRVCPSLWLRRCSCTSTTTTSTTSLSGPTAVTGAARRRTTCSTWLNASTCAGTSLPTDTRCGTRYRASLAAIKGYPKALQGGIVAAARSTLAWRACQGRAGAPTAPARLTRSGRLRPGHLRRRRCAAWCVRHGRLRVVTSQAFLRAVLCRPVPTRVVSPHRATTFTMCVRPSAWPTARQQVALMLSTDSGSP
jgi:hypothetical protein